LDKGSGIGSPVDQKGIRLAFHAPVEV
jgi:hypothetical protein